MSRQRKLTAEQEAEVRSLCQHRRNLTNGVLAQRFGVHWRTIVNAARGRYKPRSVADSRENIV